MRFHGTVLASLARESRKQKDAIHDFAVTIATFLPALEIALKSTP
jgi:hypothetical protein